MPCRRPGTTDPPLPLANLRSSFVTGNVTDMVTRQHNPGGRPKKYASSAERQAAYRARWPVIEVRLPPQQAKTLDKLAKYFDVPRTEVAYSLINFALLNRTWFIEGLFGKSLPRTDVRSINYKGEHLDMEAELKRAFGDDDGNTQDDS